MESTLRTDIEAAGERLTTALGNKDISDIREFIARDCAILPPGYPVAVGEEQVAQFWSGFAQRVDVTRLDIGGLVEVAPGLVRVIGVMTVRPRGKDGQDAIEHKYMALWRRVGDGLALVSLAWNRRPEKPA